MDAGPGADRRTQLRFRWVAEETPGDRWRALFRRAWPSYRRWYLRDGEAARPDLEACRRALGEHMPELVPMWERLSEIVHRSLDRDAGEAELAARMLTLHDPPRFWAGCSQAVWTAGGPRLMRNYDYAPLACEATIVLSAWGGTRVLASSDCLWGVLDGVNEHGLTVALAFGGRRGADEGFGMPLILRYVLQLCRTVPEAVRVLERVPSHMAYNVSLLDRSGEHAVAYTGPGRRLELTREAACTNHQPGGEKTRYARATKSVERERYLRGQLAGGAATPAELLERFLRPPLYVTGYDRGYGTLYTVAYDPLALEADFRWPDTSVRQTCDGFEEREVIVSLGG